MKTLIRLFEQFELRSTGKWFFLSAVVGMVAGLAAIVFQYAGQAVAHFSLSAVAGYSPLEAAGEHSLFHETAGVIFPWLIVAVLTVGGLISGWLVYTFAPEAEGHGTDGAINAYHHKGGRIKARVPIIKTLASAITLGTGGSCGREGPIAQIGAGVGEAFGWVAGQAAMDVKRRSKQAGYGFRILDTSHSLTVLSKPPDTNSFPSGENASEYVNPHSPDDFLSFGTRFAQCPCKTRVFCQFMPCEPGNPMGDAKKQDLRVRFDSRLKLKFCGSQVTSDAGLLAYRELDEALGLTEMGADVLTDSRQGRNKQHQLVPLLRQSIYSRLAGYEDVNDAERLCVDPALRHVVGGRASQPEKQAVSSSEVGRFETETLSTKRNLTALMNLSGRSKNSSWIWTVPSVRPTGDNKALPTTDTLNASVTIRCFCSTSMATWKTPCCGAATRPARNTGGMYCCR